MASGYSKSTPTNECRKRWARKSGSGRRNQFVRLARYPGGQLYRRSAGPPWLGAVRGKPQHPGLALKGSKEMGRATLASRARPDRKARSHPDQPSRPLRGRNISDIWRLDVTHRPGPAISGNMAMGAAMPAIFVVSLPGSGNAMYHAGGTGKANTACWSRFALRCTRYCLI